MKNIFLQVLIAFYYLLSANNSFAESSNLEITRNFSTIKKSFEQAGPIKEQDMPIQSIWFCDKYTLDFKNKTLSYSPRQFDEQYSWLVQKKMVRANYTFLKINGEVFEFTPEGLESGGATSSLFRITQDGQIIVRIIEQSDDPTTPIRAVSLGTCLKN